LHQFAKKDFTDLEKQGYHQGTNRFDNKSTGNIAAIDIGG
jgi:hypothetical protein